MQNFLESDDFSLINMTEAINILPVVPSRIGSMNLFRGGGISETTVGIERVDKELRLIPTAPRGTMPEYKTNVKRNLRAIAVPHLPKNDTVMAESVQNVRSFGSDSTQGSLEAVSSVINDRLSMLKQEHELTWEWHRIGALQGQVLDADGTSVVVDLFTEFGVTRITVNWDTTDAQGLKKMCIALRRTMKAELNLAPFTEVMVMCSEGFWDQLITSTETRDAFNRYQENVFAREGNDDGFKYSKIMFEELRGSVGAVPFVPDDEAFAFPITQAPLYRQFFAPAPFLEAVNTQGKPYYAKQEPLRFNIGTEIHTNSNPLFLVTRPRVLVQVTFSI